MPRSTIARIRDRIRQRQYDTSAHAMNEIAEDGLDILDLESAVLQGNITRTVRDDPRGTTYVIEGVAADRHTPVGVVGRFAGSGRYLVITVYVISEEEL